MATVDDLLRTLHHQAAGLRHVGDPTRQLPAHLRGWMPLANNALRVLEPLDPHPDDRELYGLLHILRRSRGVRPGRTDAQIARVALTLGALGDVLNSAPEVVGQASQVQRSRLQASIHAALHATARTTYDIARAAGRERAGQTIRKVAEATELAALLPPLARVSTLERLTVTRLTPDTADGAVQLWAGVAERTFNNFRLVTGLALQDAAATLALLCSTAADTMQQAARRRIVDPDSAREAARLLTEASWAWRAAATWPSRVQLGGRAYEHQQAAQAVRDALTGPPLARLTLRQQTHTLRAAVSTAVTIGGLQASAVTAAADRGGLWIAHERPNLRPPGVQRRHVKLDWETMGWGHPAGRLLTDQAHAARHALTVAAEALDQAVLPSASLRGDAGRIALVDHRIVADWWETIESDTRTRRTEAVPVSLAPRGPRPGVSR